MKRRNDKDIFSGAEIVIDALLQEKVEVIFGFPGGAVLDVFDELNKAPINFILARHEQGVTHMADGYARATGKVGVGFVTSGPGATNTVTGLATAYMDSIPIVVLCGQVPTSVIGNDAFQEADVVGITRPCTKHNFLVKDINDLARTIKESFYIARTGRPGPVVIDIPKDIQKQTVQNYQYPATVEMRSYKPERKLDGNAKQVKNAAAAIKRAERPVLYCGGGICNSMAHKEVATLANRCQIPVTTTLMGLGGYDEAKPLALHMLGMHGTEYANYAINACDCLIAVGARFDDRVTGKLDAFLPHVKDVIHIDIDPTAISKNVPATIPIVGDCRGVLKSLLKVVEPKKNPQWVRQIKKWKKEFPLGYPDDNKLRPQYVIETISQLTKGDTIVATEVGQHQMWAAHYFEFKKPRTFLTSGGLGTMGYGMPAAIGAQVAFPNKTVIDIAGDGSIQMNIQELATAVLHNIPIKVAIINNGFLGMVRQWQEMFYGRNYSFSEIKRTKRSGKFQDQAAKEVSQHYVPDFVKLAESFGAVGLRATKKAEVKPVVEEALANKRPCLIDFVVESEENVLPMIPAGGGVDEMVGVLI